MSHHRQREAGSGDRRPAPDSRAQEFPAVGCRTTTTGAVRAHGEISTARLARVRTERALRRPAAARIRVAYRVHGDDGISTSGTESSSPPPPPPPNKKKEKKKKKKEKKKTKKKQTKIKPQPKKKPPTPPHPPPPPPPLPPTPPPPPPPMRSRDDVVSRFNLSALRLAFNGAEPVQPGTVARVWYPACPRRTVPDAMYPVVRMAEPKTSSPSRAGHATVSASVTATVAARPACRRVPRPTPRASWWPRLGRRWHGIDVRMSKRTAPLGSLRSGEIQISGAMVRPAT